MEFDTGSSEPQLGPGIVHFHEVLTLLDTRDVHGFSNNVLSLTMSNGRMTLNYDLERMCKEAVVRQSTHKHDVTLLASSVRNWSGFFWAFSLSSGTTIR